MLWARPSASHWGIQMSTINLKKMWVENLVNKSFREPSFIIIVKIFTDSVREVREELDDRAFKNWI